MSFCPNCGKELEGNPLFCPECGAYLMNAAQGAAAQQSAPEPQPQPKQNETYYQPQQQQQGGQYYQPPVDQQQQQYQQTPNYNTLPQQPYGAPVYTPQVEDKAKVGLVIISFLIPLVGLILFLTKRKKTPKAARAYGIAAAVSVVLSVIASRFTDTSSLDLDSYTGSIVCEADAPSYDGLFI